MTYLRTLVCAGCLLLGAATTVSAQIYYPADGFVWRAAPNWGAVGDCFGNCGAGCSDDSNPCGGRFQYWELQIISEPQPTGGDWWDTECHSDTLYLVHYLPHQAWGRWTYYGHAALGCLFHDATCPEFLFGAGCFWWAGCGTEWDEEWTYDEFVTGDKRVQVEPIGSCSVPREP